MNFKTNQAEFSSVEDHAHVRVLEVVTLVAAGVGPRNLAQEVSLKLDDRKILIEIIFLRI